MEGQAKSYIPKHPSRKTNRKQMTGISLVVSRSIRTEKNALCVAELECKAKQSAKAQRGSNANPEYQHIDMMFCPSMVSLQNENFCKGISLVTSKKQDQNTVPGYPNCTHPDYKFGDRIRISTPSMQSSTETGRNRIETHTGEPIRKTNQARAERQVHTGSLRSQDPDSMSCIPSRLRTGGVDCVK